MKTIDELSYMDLDTIARIKRMLSYLNPYYVEIKLRGVCEDALREAQFSEDEQKEILDFIKQKLEDKIHWYLTK